jgi:hypothetical protein
MSEKSQAGLQLFSDFAEGQASAESKAAARLRAACKT